MLGDISVATNIFIVTGYTDMRKSIDGLCAIVYDQIRSVQNLQVTLCICFVGNVAIASRNSFMNLMDMFSCIKDSMLFKENIGGLVINRRPKVSPGSNLIG